jgi:zinc transporter ZupT
MKSITDKFPTWMILVFPLVLLLALVFIFLNSNPIQVSGSEIPPIESISIDRIMLPEHGKIEIRVTNAGPDPVSIAQVLVDDAYWQFTMDSDNPINSFASATFTLNYPWVEGEPHEVVFITSTGVTFPAEIEVAVLSPETNAEQLFAYGLVGVYVGIIPVGLGLLWFPAMRRFSRRAMNFILSLTVGLLVFLLLDTFLEMAEVAEEIPGVFQGVPLGIFFAVLTWLAIVAVGNSKRFADRATVDGRKFLAFLIALGIGFHNLGEGLVVGAAFSSGEAALGSFLVVGFILHNITEGIGIAAPVAKDKIKVRWFIMMLLISGAPAILGAIIGGFAFSNIVTVIFLGIGVGAIWQVVYEVGRLIQKGAQEREESPVNWITIAGLMVGILIMYLTAFLVKV